MGAGAGMMTLVIVITVGITAYLIGTTIRSIRNEHRTHMSLWKNFGLSLGFCALFLISWVGHAITQWQVYTDEQRSHNESVELGDFVAEFSQATLENWQSEFLQLFWQVVGLAYFLYLGSPSSKENDDRVEAKIDALLRINAGHAAEDIIKTIDYEYARTHGHAQPHKHAEGHSEEAGKDVPHVCLRKG
jgi:hypothetical protein